MPPLPTPSGRTRPPPVEVITARQPPLLSSAAAAALAAALVTTPAVAAPPPPPPPPHQAAERTDTSTPRLSRWLPALSAKDAPKLPALPPGARASPAALKAAKAVKAAETAANVRKPAVDASTPLTPAEKRAKEAAAKEKVREKEAAEKQAAQRRAVARGAAAAAAAVVAAKWPVIAGGVGLLFRNLGGPSLLAATLRAPGFLFGRVLRCVEWDVASSPDRPDGRMHTLRLRTQTPDGLRTAIAKAAGCKPADVASLAHWLAAPGGGSLLEPIGSAAAITVLPDPALIVWSRSRPGGEGGAHAGALPIEGALPPAARPAAPPQTQTDADAALAALAAATAGDEDGGVGVLAAAAAQPGAMAALWRAVGEGHRFVQAARELVGRR